MRSRQPLVFVVALAVAGLLVAGCGSSGGDSSSKGSTTTTAKGGKGTKPKKGKGKKQTPAVAATCKALGELNTTSFGLAAPKVEDRKATLATLLTQLKKAAPAAPKSLQASLLAYGVYITNAQKATAGATTTQAFDLQLKSVESQKKAPSDATGKWLKSNC